VCTYTVNFRKLILKPLRLVKLKCKYTSKHTCVLSCSCSYIFKRGLDINNYCYLNHLKLEQNIPKATHDIKKRIKTISSSQVQIRHLLVTFISTNFISDALEMWIDNIIIILKHLGHTNSWFGIN